MAIDLSRPLELDDGTPVLFVDSRGSIFRAKLSKSPYRQAPTDQDPYVNMTWTYGLNDGVFGGGDSSIFFTIRNVGPAEPEEYEGWFVD